MKGALIAGGVSVLLIASGTIEFFLKKDFVHKEDLKDVSKIIVDSDVVNVHLSSDGSRMDLEYTGKKSILGDPNVDVTYEGDQVVIKVREVNNWRRIAPINTSRGNLVLNIPSKLMDQVQISTGVGKIDVRYPSEIKELTLNSDVGTINVDYFKGEFLNVSSNVGTINLGTIDGNINVDSLVGRIKIADLSNMKGKNNIKSNNGTIKVGIPGEKNLNEVGLNISTKTGRIISENNKLSGENIYNVEQLPPGKKVINRYKGDKELNITSFVGNIKIY
ncbi:DUF4097 family beta strand repeat-containing protein [Peribacillus frigoritolerans]|uniref:DUF4097 family beta strand repeat-containing protein n=1 Tax=Peribacillus frigoritolerans TaxID=450367 RepID=UPI002ECE7884|nr:DUF4097 domain-containing protein [Peribacillus frigoritolerans]MEE3954555.1 DUF4097 family beta strand repeat-containing protein [Peribacillus frigoritolerans]